jgi:hypothetical protein
METAQCKRGGAEPHAGITLRRGELAEIEAVSPEVIVSLGATAAGARLGPSFRVTHHRGEALGSLLPAGSPGSALPAHG